MRMHACDYVWRVCAWMCVCVIVCPHAYAQVGVHESACVFECVCSCVSTHVRACVVVHAHECVCMAVCDHVVIVYYVVCGCVHDVDACDCVWLWPRKAACMCV